MFIFINVRTFSSNMLRFMYISFCTMFHSVNAIDLNPTCSLNWLTCSGVQTLPGYRFNVALPLARGGESIPYVNYGNENEKAWIMKASADKILPHCFSPFFSFHLFSFDQYWHDQHKDEVWANFKVACLLWFRIILWFLQEPWWIASLQRTNELTALP